jgi:hypothetical protein
VSDQLNTQELTDGSRRVIDLVRSLRDGAMGPKSLTREEAVNCTEYCLGEGMRPIEIAKLLDCSDRSVRRYRAEITERNALDRDPKLAGMIVGRLLAKVDHADGALRRLIRDERTPPADKVDACRALVEGEVKLAQTLQGLGHLPSAAQRIDATVELVPPKLEEIREKLSELERLSAESQRLGLAPPRGEEGGDA